MSSYPKMPNKILRRERELRGWTLQDVADRLYKLCEKEGRESNISANIVGRWERGVSIPQPHYQRKLCRLFGKSTTAELGFLEQQDVTEPPPVSQISSIPGPVPHSSNELVRENRDATLQFDKQTQSSAYSPQAAPEQSVILVAGNLAGDSSDLLQGIPEVYIPLHQAVSLLHPKADARPEQQVEAWQALIAGDLPTLFDLGWSVVEVLDAQRIILEGLHAMPERIRKMISRRALLDRFLKLLATTVVGSIPIPFSEKHISFEERTQLHLALGESIAAGWTLLHTAGPAQALAVGQAQLYLVQQVHSMLYPSVLPLYYTGVYRLIGAALHFQARYHEALREHEKAYIAALEGADAWNMAQCKSWQAYEWKALERCSDALQATDAALRLTSQQSDTESIRLRARLLALKAKNAAIMGDKEDVQSQLNASEELLVHLSPYHEEFDRVGWLQWAGICALHLGQHERAIERLQQALDELPAHWIRRYVATAIPLARAYAQIQDGKRTLDIAEHALPNIITIHAETFMQDFVNYLYEDLLTNFPNDEDCQIFAARTQQQLVLA